MDRCKGMIQTRGSSHSGPVQERSAWMSVLRNMRTETDLKTQQGGAKHFGETSRHPGQAPLGLLLFWLFTLLDFMALFIPT
mmetsp:Transcript_14206/g.26408  ORF Transcript_14206/g.26408 Transcript_14206/m.26408 type:complete len:81 (+) Transcript_14206:621-863(+)